MSAITPWKVSGGRTTLDKITESLLAEFSAEHELTHLKESKKFEHFSAFLIVSREQSESFSTQDIVVGDDAQGSGGTDTGIDAVAIVVNGELVSDKDELLERTENAGYLDVEFIFVQAETSSGFDGAKIGTFGFGVVDFFRDVPKMNRNSSITSAAAIAQAIYSRSSKFKRGNPRCKMFYVTTGKVMPDPILNVRMDGPKSDLGALQQFSSVEFVRLGADDIQGMYQRSKNARYAEFNFLNKVTIDASIHGVDQAYSGYLPWSEFKKIITNDADVLQRGLFVDNVRDWQEYNGVNSEMRDTLRSADKNRFVLMNNGVTIIARKMQPTGNKFLLENYQIVNGCQTSNVLYDNRNDIDDSVLIPVRLIGTDDEEVTNAIIRATNRQTAVKEEQFFALDTFSKKLEQFFASYPVANRLYYERRSKQYESFSIEKTRVVGFPNLIRAFAAMFLNEPHRTTRNYAGLIRKVGGDILGKDHRMEPYYVSAFALYKLGKL